MIYWCGPQMDVSIFPLRRYQHLSVMMGLQLRYVITDLMMMAMDLQIVMTQIAVLSA